jgi:hypothetical protein
MIEEFGPSHLCDHVSGCPVLVKHKAAYQARVDAYVPPKPERVFFFPEPEGDFGPDSYLPPALNSFLDRTSILTYTGAGT